MVDDFFVWKKRDNLDREIQQLWKPIAIATWIEVTQGWRRVKVVDGELIDVSPEDIQATATSCHWVYLRQGQFVSENRIGYEHPIGLEMGQGNQADATLRINPVTNWMCTFKAYLVDVESTLLEGAKTVYLSPGDK